MHMINLLKKLFSKNNETDTTFKSLKMNTGCHNQTLKFGLTTKQFHL